MGTCGLQGCTIKEIAAAWKALPAKCGFRSVAAGGKAGPLEVRELHSRFLDMLTISQHSGLREATGRRFDLL